MKIANVMCFARCYNNVEGQFYNTKLELEMITGYGIDHTFLLEYDAICHESYQQLFKEKATDKTEIGLWLEIVEPLTTACGLPYRTEMGVKWDYHIIPGFTMGYTPAQREMLADEAMRKFKEVFGYYPKTVACWMMDTHTINYLTDHYDISTLAICRDQVNFDAYTLIGGYFNQAYYPSRNNMFTPARSEACRVNVPMFRLLGPCPTHNYERTKYTAPGTPGCCTLEPVWCTTQCFDGLFKAFYENESLGFAYAQVGQENTMPVPMFTDNMRYQIERLMAAEDIQILKMCDTGELFKKTYPNKTPATAVVATENWNTEDTQSVYYDSETYVANLFRFENSTFIRSFFLFDETVEDHYMREVCTTSDAIYENQPLVNTQLWFDHDEKKNCGLVLDSEAEPFTAEKVEDGVLRVSWKDKYVQFEEHRLVCKTDKIRFFLGDKVLRVGEELVDHNNNGNKFYVNPKPDMQVNGSFIEYEYKGNRYRLRVENAALSFASPTLIEMTPTTADQTMLLYPEACR
jgi:hypothetical protein